MKQIRITTATGESVHVIAKGAVPQLVAGELTVALHDGETLRLPIQNVNGYVVEDAKRPTKLDKLAAEHAAACEAVETAAEGVYAFARGEASVSDETFRDALDAYVRAVDDRAAALDSLKAGQIAAARAKERAEKRKASGDTPKPKKPAVKKAAKK
jgi:hypothetical protein